MSRSSDARRRLDRAQRAVGLAAPVPCACRCRAKSKRSGVRCRKKPEPGRRVCRMHGAGGGRPIIHGRYSKVLARAFAPACRSCGALL